MKQLPARPNLEHLKKQAKELLRLYKAGDPEALARFRHMLPTALGKDDSQIAVLGLRLHDAQSCVAREYGFASWLDLRSHAEARAALGVDISSGVLHWLRLVYAGETSGGDYRPRPALAARLLKESPGLTDGYPYLACATGAEEVLREVTKTDPAWVNRPGGPLNMPPLVAVTHSSLVRLPEFRDSIHRSAKLLLNAGADPNQFVGLPEVFSDELSDAKLSALYGAAGQNHDPEMTELLLLAGADPNDGESLYHSLEQDHSLGNLSCTRLLLERGARIEGSNALYRVLDFDSIADLELLLAHGANPNEPATSAPTNDFGCPLLWAIRRRRSAAHIEALLGAGANPEAKTPAGVSAYHLALQFGLPEIAGLPDQAGAGEPISEGELFIAACTRADEEEARRLQAIRKDLPASLSESQLRLLPELAAAGANDAVRVMVRLGWPIAVQGGDWNASALNHAVFRGDPALARFLLAQGASWRETHGFGDNLCGTLSFASCNEPSLGGDWLGCAEALVAFGMPAAEPDPEEPGWVLIDGRQKRFSDEVTDFLLSRSNAQ